MKFNKTLLLGILIILQTACNNYQDLIEIDHSSELNLQVNEAYNERGIYILNNKYYLNSSIKLPEDIKGIQIEDDAIWRPNGLKNIPRLSDIDAPFQIFKEKNNDSIYLIKANDTIILKLDKLIQ
ncbi:hypothetical protein [Flavobacterium sp. Root186]|uniref:hypothetical protein n=1 Tax=Flavobacterium sp. Root186 TaxID=1736485 RepID=UPI00070040CF|nr:hypothetical protein [Flavobacterium sp. Root186]KRB59022.1 hypothetical protein ASD98_23375 [Flavobacterium sp. Root186]